MSLQWSNNETLHNIAQNLLALLTFCMRLVIYELYLMTIFNFIL